MCSAPGPIDTPIFNKIGFPAEQIAGFKQAMSSKSLVGRLGTSEEVGAIRAVSSFFGVEQRHRYGTYRGRRRSPDLIRFVQPEMAARA